MSSQPENLWTRLFSDFNDWINGIIGIRTVTGFEVDGAIRAVSTDPEEPDERILQRLRGFLVGVNDDVLTVRIPGGREVVVGALRRDGDTEGSDSNIETEIVLNRANHIGVQLAATIADFSEAVAVQTDVSANTSARHSHTNLSILQAITAAFTTEEKTKLTGIQAGAEVNVNADWAAATGDAHILNKPATFPASAHTHPSAEITDLATTITNNPSVSASASARHTHANLSTLDATTAAYTTAEKTKLSGIQAGAEVNVQADWAAATGDAQILNKPTSLPPGPHTHPSGEITGLSAAVAAQTDVAANTAARHSHTNKAVLDAVTAAYTSADKTKLDGIAAGAEVNVQSDWAATSGDAQILNKPTALPPGPHTHPSADITDLSATIGGQADVAANTAARHSHTNKAVLDATTAAFTTALNTKLAGIQAGAEVNVNPDWNATSGDAQILNKPTALPAGPHTHTAPDITDFAAAVSAHSDVTANTAARHSHANKATLDATTAAYTAEEKTKLGGIAAGAEVNVQADWAAVSGDAQILNKPTSIPASAHTHPSGEISDFATAVAAHAAVSANTAARHSHTNKTTLDATTAAFTTALNTKLGGIAAGAEVNVNPNWTATSGDGQILNKPATFPPAPHTHAITDLQAVGSPTGLTFLRGDGTWAVPDTGGSGALMVDVRDFGTIGTANDSSVFQAALTALGDAGGGTLYVPGGHFFFLQGLTIPRGVHMFGCGEGRTILDFSGMTAGVTGPYDSFSAAIMGTGIRTILPTLAAAILVGAQTITFSSAPSVAPGDTICIYNTIDSAFNSARTYYRNGEFATVRSVSGNVVTLANRIISSTNYSMLQTEVYKVDGFTGGLTGMTVKGKNGFRTVRLDWGRQLSLQDLDLTGSDYANLEIGHSYIVRCQNIRSVDFSTFTALNYGISIGNCQDVVISESHLVTTRHGITIGGYATPGSVPNRVITIRNTWIEGVETGGGVTGFSPHGNTEYLTLEGCWLPSGITMGGDHMTVQGCDIGQNKDGQCIHSGELLGYDIKVIGCSIRGGINYQSTPQALMYFMWGPEAARGNGTVLFEGNKVDLAGSRIASGSSAQAIHLLQNGPVPATNDVIFRNNEVWDTVGPVLAARHVGMTLRSTNDNHFRTITIDGWTGNLGFNIEGISARTVRLSGIHIVDALGWGVRFAVAATTGHGHTDVVLEDISVLGSQNTGLIVGGSTSKIVDVFMADVTILDNAILATGSTQMQSSMYVYNVRNVVRRNAVVGDRKATPTQTRADAFLGITLLVDIAPVVLGSVTTLYRSGVTATRLLAVPA